MREGFECAVLSAQGVIPSGEDWVKADLLPAPLADDLAEVSPPPLVMGKSVADGRLKLHRLPLDTLLNADPAALLADAALLLQRYDACVLAVETATLPWARKALARAVGVARTPILALVREYRAAPLTDLFDLGVADVLRAPLCAEELRLRVKRATMPRAILRDEAPTLLREPATAYRIDQDAAHPCALTRPASRRRPLPVASTEPYQDAKARVLDNFERDYLRHALSDYGGNVTHAAQAARKHRRAFWALMQKHGIHARPYRNAAQAMARAAKKSAKAQDRHS